LRSVSKAAERLGLEQPTVSHTLSRLRSAFGDQLFFRTGRTLQPTERCKTLFVAFERILSDIDRTTQAKDFDPATSTRRIRISGNFLERAVFFPRLLKWLRTNAPGISLEIIPSGGGRAADDALLSGDCDFLLRPVQTTHAKVRQQRVAVDRYACLVDKTHWPTENTLTQTEYLKAVHLIATYDGQFEPPFLKLIGNRAVEMFRHNCAGTSDLPFLLQGTDMVATAPTLLASVAGNRFDVRPFPFGTATLDFYLSWTPRAEADPTLVWVKSGILLVANQLKTAVSETSTN